MSSLLPLRRALGVTAGPGRVAGARVQAPWLVDSSGCTWTLALSDVIIVCGMYPAAIGRSTFLLHKAGL